MKNKPNLWLIGFLCIVLSLLVVIGSFTVAIDPFFHYHVPDTENYYYSLNNLRSQNDGILKHFSYQGIITGTSMTQQFLTSEAEKYWNFPFVKAFFQGGYFKEINDNLSAALLANKNIDVIIRGLDQGIIIKDKNHMYTGYGEYPTYLYDSDIFNDVEYIFNRDVVFSRIYPMYLRRLSQKDGGITPFDELGLFSKENVYGKGSLFPRGGRVAEKAEPQYLSEYEITMVMENVKQNITDLADQYPEVKFYYFFTPYSAAWWKKIVEDGTIYKEVEAQRLATQEILKHQNIKLYSFNNCLDIITDLNNYKDETHYGIWINSLILKYIYEEKYLLTLENYNDYYDEELELYLTYDFSQLFSQEDYINDFFAAAKMCEQIYGTSPYKIDLNDSLSYEISRAEVVEDQYNGLPGVLCQGNLDRDRRGQTSISQFIWESDYIGIRIREIDVTQYHFLMFYGKKISNDGEPSIYIYNESGDVMAELTKLYKDVDTEWHQYLIDISNIQGEVTIVFNGGYTDNSSSLKSKYLFSDIVLY